MDSPIVNLDGVLIRLLQIFADGMVVYDPTGTILWCNQAAAEMIGKDPGELISRPVKEEFAFVHFDQETSTATIHDPGQAKILEIKHVVLDENNSASLKAIALRDITATTRNELELKEVKQKNENYEDILNSLDHGVQVINERGIITFYNPVQERLDNMKKEFVLGKHMTEVYKLDEESSFLLRVLKYGKPIDDRQDYITASGKLVNIISTAVPLYRNNRMVGAVAITKDFDIMWEFSKRVLAPGAEIPGKQRGKNKESLFTRQALYTFQDIVGQNRQLGNAIVLAKKAALSPSPVLISGETGTGKELFAQSIHAASNRRAKHFMAINCAAIPENLLEGILFGTVPGAFTGAIDRPGLFEQSSGGTVFLDEINSMPLALQAKLLRVIQEGVVRRVGGTQDRSIDIRIISSTNEEPMAAIHNRTLRSDLFYRLGVVHISIPPLRSRKDDLPLLVDFFIHEKNRKLRQNVRGITQEVADAFFRYDWPGNIRQLEHVIECAMNGVNHEIQISMEHLPEYIRQEFVQADPDLPALIEIETGSFLNDLDNYELNRIMSALKKADGNISQAAKTLAITRQCLQYKMKKFQISVNRNISNL